MTKIVKMTLKDFLKMDLIFTGSFTGMKIFDCRTVEKSIYIFWQKTAKQSATVKILGVIWEIQIKIQVIKM